MRRAERRSGPPVPARGVQGSPVGLGDPGRKRARGESSVEGAIRELCEEVGIDVSNDSTTFIGRFTEDSALFDLYAAPVASEATVSPDAIEVADTRWVTIAEFDEMFASGAMAAPWKPRMAAFRKRFGEVVNELSPAR